MSKIFKALDNTLDLADNINIRPFKTVGGGKSFKNNDSILKTIVDRRTLRRRRKIIPNATTPNKMIFNHNNKIFDNTKLNKTAQKMGFKNAFEFEDYIKNINPYKLVDASEAQRLSKIFNYLSKTSKKRGGSIAKLAIAGGSLTAMIIFLKKFQKKYSGCFRYENDDEEKIKYKFVGFFCGGDDDNDDDDDDNVKLLSIEEHPLFGVKKWDCDYDNFEKGNKRVDEILQLGCKGLCDWKNFNILAETTKGEYNPIYPADDKYIYKCETMSLLKAFSTSTGNAVNEIVSGIIFSDLGQNITSFFFRLLYIVVLILALLFIIFNYYNKKMKNFV